MSAPGYTNHSNSVGYSQNSTPNGGAAPPRQNGPLQGYPPMYPPAGYYGTPPPRQNYPNISGPVIPTPGKALNANSASYYQNNQQHHVAPTS